MTKTLTGLFHSRLAAANAVRELEAAGIASSHISLVAGDADQPYELPGEQEAGAGAGIGAVLGGGAGLLTGLGLVAIPGIGPVLGAGWLVSTLVGVVAGATAGGMVGGIVGALTEAGVSEEDAHVYAEGVRRGGALVTVKTDDALAPAAEQILMRHEPSDPTLLRQTYAGEGWSADTHPEQIRYDAQGLPLDEPRSFTGDGSERSAEEIVADTVDPEHRPRP